MSSNIQQKTLFSLTSNESFKKIHSSPEATLANVRRLANFLDNRFKVMGVGVGWDGIIGLIPGIGDIITAGLSSYVIWLAHQHGVPKRTLMRMLANAGFDMTLGAIPLVGDAADFAFKANLKNLRLLEKHLQGKAKQTV